MAQTTDRLIIRRSMLLAGGKRLIFDKEDDIWRVAFYRARKPGETGNQLAPELQAQMEKAGMLPKEKRNHWARFTTKAPTLAAGIYTVLDEGDCRHLHRDIIYYLENVEWSWYLDA